VRRLGAVLGSVVLAGTTGCELSLGADDPVVAFLVGDAASPRWESEDLAAFGEQLAEGCPSCVVLERDAGGDPDRQGEQVGEVLDEGADLLVVNAVTREAGEDVVAAAGGVPVVAYGVPVPGADRLVAVDPGAAASGTARAVRRLGGGGRLDALVVTGPAGSARDEITRGVVAALGTDVRVVGEVEDPDGSGVARRARRADLVVTGSDQDAGVVAAALADLAVPVTRRPLLTGHDGELDAVRRLVVGSQAVTVYVSRADQGRTAARVALHALEGVLPAGEPSPSGSGSASTDPSPVAEPSADGPESAEASSGSPAESGTAHDERGRRLVDGVPATLVPPTVVTRSTVTEGLVRPGRYDTEEICAGRVGSRCTALGIR
jgi:D-xylose transport system substrate-binding protein